VGSVGLNGLRVSFGVELVRVGVRMEVRLGCRSGWEWVWVKRGGKWDVYGCRRGLG